MRWLKFLLTRETLTCSSPSPGLVSGQGLISTPLTPARNVGWSALRGTAAKSLWGHLRLVTGQTEVNGWNYPPRATGRLTPTRDWLLRALQLQAGFVVNDPIEATYLNVSVDGDGRALSGNNRYIIHFDKGGEPKVKAFWSVTMYNLKYNLVANPIDRYSIGDRSGMKTDADGGLTIYVQHGRPGSDKESNWLPSPDGPFFLVLRTYLPADDIVNQTWQPPKITAVGR